MNKIKPLVIDGSDISENAQVLLKVIGHPKLNVVGMVNTICICQMQGLQWSIACQAGLELGRCITLRR